MTTPVTTNTQQGVSTIFWVLLFGIFFAYLLLGIALGYPILASDEYLYYISGKYLNDLTSIQMLDPYLQKTANLFYFKMVNAAFYIFHDQSILGLRLIHVLEYFLCMIILYKTFEKHIPKAALLKGCIAFSILPSSLYLFTSMPEIELMLLGCCLMYSVLAVLPSSPIRGSLLAGVTMGLAILVKPHAVAMIACAILVISMQPFITQQPSKKSIMQASINLVVFLISTYISFLLIWRLCSSEWLIDPRAPLGLNFYGRYLNTETVSTAEKLLGISQYIGIHLLVLYVVFSPVMVYLCRTIIEFLKRDTKQTTSFEILLSLFTLSFIFIHVVMVAYFTFNAGQLNEGENLRIHGRYLGAAIGLLAFIYFFSVEKIHKTKATLFWVMHLFSFFVFILWIKNFKIFPWDYPLLFAFFTEKNSYSWSFSQQKIEIKTILLLFILMAGILALVKEKWRKPILNLQLFIIIFAGSTQTYNWLYHHLAANKNNAAIGQMVAKTFSSETPGKGLIVTSERYGKASYILFNMADAPRVLVKPAGEKISESDAAGADWIITTDPYIADFSYQNKLEIKGIDFYNISSSVTISKPQLHSLKIGDLLQLRLGTAGESRATTSGFNDPEEWGSWSSEENAEIHLPATIDGKISIEIFGWMLAETANKIVHVQIGNEMHQLNFSEKPELHSFEVKIATPIDTLRLHSATITPNNSHRAMGIAISYINIKKIDSVTPSEK
ncbi:glycosyltransferase family 39 protein [Cellvibrio sp. KY-YJ-3]|uniref:ArnT family glycosyltransferase n=1 Tax=Cellvibrio sp. KY-YJ-3 TaxID=454662 RepID=UPI001247EAD4|nr:glycosyltransferase family 39 protein [Cellvibrio sp. KY-YJ-3]QEY11315.1 hypothetical protein D0B88_03010 [Cellvibrio sp. KY-YJ-3]